MPTSTRFYFDFVDPLSYLVELSLLELEAGGDVRIERIGFELRPPPTPLALTTDAPWAARWEAARSRSDALAAVAPRLVPWTRKAHELYVLAEPQGRAAAVRRRIFEAYLRDGTDVGRIDELLRVAVACGLDRTETKAALDVDRHEADVVRAREAAVDIGISDVPAALVAGRRVQGFHKLTDLSTLLGGPPGGGR